MYISERTTVGLTTNIPSIDIRNNIGSYNNKILDFFNEFFKDLKDRIITEYNKSQYPSIINTIKLNKEDIAYMYSVKIHQILEYVNEIAIVLKKQPLIDEEFFDFLEIQQIAEYILKNQDYTKPNVDELKIVLNIFEEFGDLITNKAVLLDVKTSENQDKYKKNYSSFDEKFSKYKEQFYLEIYTPSGKHNTTIDNLYAIMKE
ncbi:MAG: hypothetical protein ACLQG5_00560 [Methanobacterium sp.]|jgi:hypothetical protein